MGMLHPIVPLVGGSWGQCSVCCGPGRRGPARSQAIKVVIWAEVLSAPAQPFSVRPARSISPNTLEMWLGYAIMSPERGVDMAQGGEGRIELSVGDIEDFDALYEELRGVRGIKVYAAAPTIEPGDQGAVLDLLSVALSGGAVAALLEIVKTLLESRGPGFVLKVRHGRDRLEITSDNADEALELLKKLLDEQ